MLNGLWRPANSISVRFIDRCTRIVPPAIGKQSEPVADNSEKSVGIRWLYDHGMRLRRRCEQQLVQLRNVECISQFYVAIQLHMVAMI